MTASATVYGTSCTNDSPSRATTNVIEGTGATWIGGDGNLFWFHKLPDGSYLPPEGQLRGASLVANGNGTFTMTDRHGEQSQFDHYGLLTSRVDRVGNATTLSYIDLDSDGVPDSLSQMVDPAGRTTTFAYVDGRLDAITDYPGRVTGMTYDAAGRLTTVTRPDKAPTRTRPRCSGPPTWPPRRPTGKRGQEPFAGTARRVLRRKES